MTAPSINRPFRPRIFRPEADAPLPVWPVVGLISLVPLWFLLGLAGFTWVIFTLPMAASLMRRRDLVVPKSFGLWALFVVAVVGSSMSIDSADRMAGWLLRFGYYVGGTVFLLYVLNGRDSVTPWTVIRAFVWLWMATVVGGYLAFLLGEFSFWSPMAYLMPGGLRSNELIGTLVTPSFAEVQDIIGFPIPRPKAPFPYTNSWGSMLALLTPFALIAQREARVGFSNRLIRFFLVASVIPAVVSLNRGLWISLGLGMGYVALRLGAAGQSKALRNTLIAFMGLALLLVLTPLGDLIVTRFATGHSNNDRLELVKDAVAGTLQRPVFGWGAPRPNDRNLPSVGTHGQMWFVMFSYGFVGALGYFGAFTAWAWRTRRQVSVAGLWCHAVILIGLIQAFFYLHVPHQMFTMLAATALAIRIQAEDAEQFS